jgi:hypothetical protein
MQSANARQTAAMQEEYQQKAKLIRLAKEVFTTTTQKPTRAVEESTAFSSKKPIHSTSVMTEEPEEEQMESAIPIDDTPTQITDGYYDEYINPPQKEATAEKQPQSTSKLITLCRNTVIGNDFITDSRGYTCNIEDLDHVTQCCSTQPKKSISRYSCKSCEKHGCCSVYEHCVSCCLAPEHREDLRENYDKRKTDRLYRGVTTVFQFCATRCRTTSGSVINQNRYRSPLKHCMSRKDPADIENLTSMPT